MKRLWSLSTAHSYHDFTTVFTQDALDGWLTMRKKLAFQEIVSREGLRRWHGGRKERNFNGKEGSIFLPFFSLFLPLISPSFFLLIPPLFYSHFVSSTQSFILSQNFYFLSLLRLVHRPKIFRSAWLSAEREKEEICDCPRKFSVMISPLGSIQHIQILVSMPTSTLVYGVSHDEDFA